MRDKCIMVIGPESTGTHFISQILVCAAGIRNDMDTAKFGDFGEIENEMNRVHHISLPTSPKAVFMPIEQMVVDFKKQFKEVYVVCCTRDITMSEKSRLNRMPFRTPDDVVNHTEHANKIISGVIENHSDISFIWSYETFMFLKHNYMKKLYEFLKIENDFTEYVVNDANPKYIK